MQIGEQVRPRAIRPESIELPAGYYIEPVASGLNYPTALSWDGQAPAHRREHGPFGRSIPPRSASCARARRRAPAHRGALSI